MEARGWKETLKALKPTSLLDYWTIAAFLAAVLSLFYLRTFDLRVLFFCLFPPLVAFIHKDFSDRKSTRVFSALFLTMIGAGVALAPAKDIFPELGGVAKGLTPEHDRILAWYTVVYLLCVFGGLPAFLFGRGLMDRFRRGSAQFSLFTCILGLVACAVVAPLMFWLCCEHLGLCPLLKQT
jgi:hypothetical protein